LNENWKWDDDWTIDINRAVDNEGWEYCVEQTMGGWSPSEKIYHLNRRRRWIRNRSILNSQELRLMSKVFNPITYLIDDPFLIYELLNFFKET
jgi:hypothetical protein